MRGVIALAVVGGAVGWLYARGWRPSDARELVRRERERLPRQLRESLAAGRRAAAERERRLEEELAGTLGNRAAGGI